LLGVNSPSRGAPAVGSPGVGWLGGVGSV